MCLLTTDCTTHRESDNESVPGPCDLCLDSFYCFEISLYICRADKNVHNIQTNIVFTGYFNLNTLQLMKDRPLEIVPNTSFEGTLAELFLLPLSSRISAKQIENVIT